jgi:hypothetical protein
LLINYFLITAEARANVNEPHFHAQACCIARATQMNHVMGMSHQAGKTSQITRLAELSEALETPVKFDEKLFTIRL